MENSHKKVLNISGRKKNESFPFTFFFLKSQLHALLILSLNNCGPPKKKRQFGKHLLRNYQNC